MFDSEDLNRHLRTSHTIENKSAVFMEWNLNQPDNIKQLGNYRYRPGTSNNEYGIIYPIFDPEDVNNNYTGATDCDVVIDAGYEDDGTAKLFVSPKEKMRLLYSLEDCIKPHRPRSGINKLLYLGVTGASYGYNKYIDSLTTAKNKQYYQITGINGGTQAITYMCINDFSAGDYVEVSGVVPESYNISEPKKIINATSTSFTVAGNNSYTYVSGGTAIILASVNIARRPRHYVSSRFDQFKYWTSYRTESEKVNGKEKQVERGVSQLSGLSLGGLYYIDDAAPFVVYKESVPANRLVVKMQTNVGDINLGPFRVSGSNLPVDDPLYGDQNKDTPKRWRVQILQNELWNDAMSFTESSTRSDGSPIIKSNGTVELEFGLKIPEAYKDYFVLIDTVYSPSLVPDFAPIGYAYLVKENSTDKGKLHISDGSSWLITDPIYEWMVSDEDVTRNTNVCKKLVDPDYFEEGVSIFREFVFIDGIRIVVETMNTLNSTFDLIEMSPRLVYDASEKIISFSINKTLSDLGNNSVPVGNLLASTGQVQLFDYDFAFNENNTFDGINGSIIGKYIDTQSKFTFFDIISNVDGFDYYIPLKTLFSEGFPQVNDTTATISMNLRDMYFFLESQKATQMLLTDVSLSYAITVLLDSIGFSNYVFKRAKGENDLIIPYFFVGPNQNIAEVLQQLAMSSQSAMFFDEYNNLVIMSKGYIIPEKNQRSVDLTFYGQEEVVDSEINLPNIMSISSKEKKVYNGGQINYTTRYIQRSLASIRQAVYLSDEDKSYTYKPVLLWEVAGQQQKQTINELNAQSSGYALAAAPLNTSLNNSVPYVDAETLSVKNNIIDLGGNVYWLGNYSGFLYSGGEIIRYDAIEYCVQGFGNIWITDNNQYQDYFSKLRFNGKMYPTGNVRIYSEPKYEYDEITGLLQLKPGEVKEHGRSQFGTQITSHSAGAEESGWTDDLKVRGCIQSAKQYLFSLNSSVEYPSDIGPGKTGLIKNTSSGIFDAMEYSKKSTRNGIIKNQLTNKNLTESEATYLKTTNAGSIQSSALVFNGPALPSYIDPVDFVSYAFKSFDQPYKHFGTRLRVIGKIESSTNKSQTASGGYEIISSNIVSPSNSNQSTVIRGGSGGLAFNINPKIDSVDTTYTNNGYFFEIVALTSDNISQYNSNNAVSFFTIAKYPEGVITTANVDAVTVTTQKQHDFNVGNIIVVSGLVDQDNKSNYSTPLNGEFKVTEISTDRKSFKYVITPPNPLTSSITSVTGNGDIITYTSNNSFKAGQKITITGVSSSSFNLSNAIIYSANSTTFTIKSTVTGGGTGGTATYVPLTTTSQMGGTASRIIDSSATISNVLFYKVSSGSNISDLIKKKRTSNKVTLTTARPHSFIANDKVIITGTGLDGTFPVLSDPAPTTYTFSYTLNGADIAETDLSPIGTAKGYDKVAIPQVLWKGLSEIIVDDGKFTGQSRLANQEKTTVYDLAAEYVNIGSTRRFYLYLNGKQIATVDDDSPLPEYNNMALFVRGSSKCMFENVYAMVNNYSENASGSLQLPVSKSIIDDQDISISESMRKYSLSGMVQNTYLSGISTQGAPQYQIYFEEFGTIMREVAYFNAKYDRAYPALYAKIADTVNNYKGYTVSGFFSDAYGAEFLVFNCIDKNLNLDDTSGNYLRILGIAFTQSTSHTITVDDYFKKVSNLSNPLVQNNYVTTDIVGYEKIYDKIKNSRMKYGSEEFSIESPYLQTTDAAEQTLAWVIERVIDPKKTIGINAFGTETTQLGDIVTLNYKNQDGIYVISDTSTRYVVYNIEYNVSQGNKNMTIHLAEV